MTEKLINDIVKILDNVYYWQSCPQEYNDKIDVITKELKNELKKLRVADVVGRSEQLLCSGCGRTESQHNGKGTDICPNNGGRFRAK